MKLKVKKAIPEKEEILACKKCGLSNNRRFVVMGRGVMEAAKILVIGEAPGTSEDLLSEAFIGASGKLLDKMLLDSRLSEFPIFFTNCILCRPCDGRGQSNREPKPEELLSCSDNVKWIIERVNPLGVVLAGNIAQSIFKKEFRVSVAIQHPSFLLRSGGMKSPYYLQNVKLLERLYNEVKKIAG